MPLKGEVTATLPTLDEAVRGRRPGPGEGGLGGAQAPALASPRAAPGAAALEILTAHPACHASHRRSLDHPLLVEARRLREDTRVREISITRVEHAIRLAERHGFEGRSHWA